METGKLEKTVDAIKAMAHPVRLQMLYALKSGEWCVCDLQALSKLDMSTVSKHLSVLKRAGLVSVRKDKNWMIYSLARPCVLNFADCMTRELCAVKQEEE